MNIHELLTKNPILSVITILVVAAIILKFGPLFALLLALFIFILYNIIQLYKRLFSKKNPYNKLRKMLAGKMLFDNNIWMEKEFDLMFDNIKYMCKKYSYKVVLFKIQIEEIANIRNKAKDESSEEYKMAELAIKRIEDFQKTKILLLEDKKEKEPEATQEQEVEEEETTPKEQKEIVVKIEQPQTAPKKPALPTDPKEAIHKSLLIDSLVTRLTDKAIYTYVSLNPELRVRLRAFLQEHSDKKAEIVEVKVIKKHTDYIDSLRIKFLENLKKKKAYKHTETVFKVTQKTADTLKNKYKEARKFKK